MEDGRQILQNVGLSTDKDWPICSLCLDSAGTPTRHAPYPKLDKAKTIEILLDLEAAGGIVQDNDGEFVRMSLEKVAHLTGWARQTFYDWQDADPQWNTKVLNRIPKANGAKKVARVVRGLFTQAAMGKQAQAELYLRHFWPDYKDPKQITEHEFSYADLLTAATEGKIINADYTDAGTGSEDQPALPAEP